MICREGASKRLQECKIYIFKGELHLYSSIKPLFLKFKIVLTLDSWTILPQQGCKMQRHSANQNVEMNCFSSSITMLKMLLHFELVTCLVTWSKYPQ